MEQGYEFTLTHMRRTILEQTDINQLYIPLQGKHSTNLEEEPFELAEKINSFLEFNDMSNYDPKVMLLMGDTGSGKSVFSQQMHQQLWKVYRSGDPIPLWIPLPELQNPFESAVEEVLTKYEFSEAQIAEIKAKEKFIFVVDGYDELHQFQNCYVTNKWNKWNSKVLITCRSQALYYQKDSDKYFMPFNGEKRLPMLLRRLYVAPFSKEQISAYVKQYQQLNAENKISEGDFSKVPGLTQLINTPFLLHLAVEALPDILANQVDDGKMTQAKLYDVFIEWWYIRQVKKLSAAGLLKDTVQTTKQQFWDFCKKLAQQMHEKEVSVIPYQGQKVSGRLFGKQEQASIWDGFFNEETELLRSACPLRRFGDYYYGFIHASMIEYFATRAMYEEIQSELISVPSSHSESSPAKVKTEKSPRGTQTSTSSDATRRHAVNSWFTTLPSRDILRNIPAKIASNEGAPLGGIHERIFAHEPQSIRFLADRIEMSETFKQKMITILEASKKSKHYAIGAANAITALVRAGVTFNGANLSEIKIAGSDISGGYFDLANFTGANLSEVSCANTWLRGAVFSGCKMEEVYFGEYPWFKHRDEVNSLVYRTDLNRLVTASGNNILFWDLVTGKQVKKFEGHKNTVLCVSMSEDGNAMASGDANGTIRIWDIESDQVKILNLLDSVSNVHLSSNGKVVASFNSENIFIWKVDDLMKCSMDIDLFDYIHQNSSQDGDTVDSGSEDNSEREGYVYAEAERLLNLAMSHAKILRVNGERNYFLSSVYLSLNGETVVSGGKNGTVRIWSVISGQMKELCGHRRSVTSVYMSLDGMTVVSASEDNTVRVWDVMSGQVKVLSGHQDCVTSVHLSLDTNTVVSASKDKTVRVWDVASGKAKVLFGHQDCVTSIHLSLDGETVVSASNDKTVRKWDTIIAQVQVSQTHEMEGHKIRPNMFDAKVRLSADGRVVASTGGTHNIVLWYVNIGVAKVLHGHKNTVTDIQLSQNGEILVSSSYDSTVRVWNVTSGHSKVLSELKGIRSFHLSQNGEILLTADEDRKVKVWNIASGEAEILSLWDLQNLGDYESHVDSVHMSLNGKIVVAEISEPCLAKTLSSVPVWDVVSGEVKVLCRHKGGLEAIQLSPDGKTLITVEDKTVRVWDLASGKVKVLHKNQQIVTSVHLSVDGKFVYWSGWDKKVYVWAMDSKSQACSIRLGSEVRSFSVQDVLGLLVVECEDYVVQLWQRLDDFGQSWQMKWSSANPNRILTVQDCDVRDSQKLSSMNRRLLKQRGAIVESKTSSKLLSIAKHSDGFISDVKEIVIKHPKESQEEDTREFDRHETGDPMSVRVKWQPAKRSGSPIHNHGNNDNMPVDDHEDEEEKARHCVIT